jgi:hypothetical protein
MFSLQGKLITAFKSKYNLVSAANTCIKCREVIEHPPQNLPSAKTIGFVAFARTDASSRSF